MHEARTLKALLTVASRRLKGAGVSSPWREARHLMQHVCKMTSADIIREEDTEMSDHDRENYFDLIERRAASEPYEYLTGEAHFYGLDFHCSHATLIPRADSEIVVDEALARLPLGRDAIVADLGTGTGCLLIALLKSQPGLAGIGIEQSPDAADIARRNLARHSLEGRARIDTMSWADWDGWSSVDLVISNPPYIASDIIGTLDTSVKAFEPHEALDGGADGLSAYRSIVNLARQHMKPGAWLVFEIGFDQREAVTALLQQAGFGSISCGQDHGQRDRVVCARQ